MYKNVLVVGSENHSGGLDFTTRGRSVSVIFGDGAGAVVVSRNHRETGGILSTHLHSEGKHKDELALQGPSTGYWVPELLANNPQEDIPYFPYMNGPFVFKHAVVRFSEVIHEGLQANGISTEDIDMLIPHQANVRIIDSARKRLGLSPEKVYVNIQKYGNTTSATLPLLLSDFEDQLKKGDKLILAAFGGGFTWGSAYLTWAYDPK